jgi:hypothetical protein
MSKQCWLLKHDSYVIASNNAEHPMYRDVARVLVESKLYTEEDIVTQTFVEYE